MKAGDYLRLHIPVEGFTPDQRARAVNLGSKVERQLVKLLKDGADPDRLMTRIESYFAGD